MNIIDCGKNILSEHSEVSTSLLNQNSLQQLGSSNAESSVSCEKRQCLSILPAYHWDGTDGCLTCGGDDDHSLLMICELCNAEQHTYCVNPPLDAVPDGDFYCDKCKPHKNLVPPKNTRPSVLHKTKIVDSPFPPSHHDNLDYLINALPPMYTLRFGEIVWAAGGVGFGWWPACIYDPRLTVGNARSLAKRHLGKKHLVYFFECHDAPFSVLNDSKLCSWLEGCQEEYDLGKTAKAMSKSRGVLFDKALMVAKMEFEKPVEMRLEWNHQDEDLNVKAGNRMNLEQEVIETKSDIDNGGRQSNLNIEKVENNDEEIRRSRRKTRNSSYPLEATTTRIRIGIGRPRRGTRGKSHSISVETVEEAEALATALELSAAEEAKRKKMETCKNDNSNHSADFECLEAPIKTFEKTKVKRNNVNAVLSALSSLDSETSRSNDPVYCKIFLRKPTRSIHESELQNDEMDKDNFYNIGFITLKNLNHTFEEARNIIDSELSKDDIISSSFPKTWKFYAPNLGPMSGIQEKQLRLKDFAPKYISSNAMGSYQSPQHIIIQDFTRGLVSHMSTGVQTGSTEPKTQRRKRNIILPTCRNKKEKEARVNERE